MRANPSRNLEKGVREMYKQHQVAHRNIIYVAFLSFFSGGLIYSLSHTANSVLLLRFSLCRNAARKINMLNTLPPREKNNYKNRIRLIFGTVLHDADPVGISIHS